MSGETNLSTSLCGVSIVAEMTSDDTSDDSILISKDGPICTVRLNRPEALNAANAVLHSRLASIWGELAEDDECRVVILTGQGRAFCAGGDLELLKRMNESESYRLKILEEAGRIVKTMADFPLPIVAAVNGPAVGLGCSLAGLSDIVLIESSAYFSDPHVSVGLTAGDGGAITWPLQMSVLKAKEYLFLCDRIPAAVAVEMGIANRVVEDGSSVEEALALAQRLARQPAQALRETKRAVNKSLHRSIHEILDFTLAAEALSSGSAEHRKIIDRMSAPREARK
jgi:enoyl-CoA hydratase